MWTRRTVCHTAKSEILVRWNIFNQGNICLFLSDKIFLLTRHFLCLSISLASSVSVLNYLNKVLLLVTEIVLLVLSTLMLKTRIAIIIRHYKYKTALSKSEFLISSILSFWSIKHFFTAQHSTAIMYSCRQNTIQCKDSIKLSQTFALRTDFIIL